MPPVLLYEGHVFTPAGATIRDAELWLQPAELQQLGWTLEPEGMCQGERCVPMPPGEGLIDSEGRVSFTGFARYLGAPVLHDEEAEAWAVGAEPPPPFANPVAVAPDFSLPDLQGRMHSLSEHRGRKVFLASWASW